jgi:hypothetical protein
VRGAVSKGLLELRNCELVVCLYGYVLRMKGCVEGRIIFTSTQSFISVHIT